MNWDSIKFRASSWGNLLTEPQEKAARERGELSKTCQAELFKIYNMEVFGRKKDITTRQMEKGIIAEPDSITLLCRLDKKLYEKNEKRYENEWFCGHPDIVTEDECLDIKTSWELDSFTPKLMQSLDKAYEAQLNCYFSLTQTNSGAIVYCLVSAPPIILEQEKRKLLWNMPEAATDLNPEYLEAAAELEKLMMFEDIPYEMRVIKHQVYRNDELIEKMQQKVPRLREFLAEIHKKHSSFLKKDIILS